MLVAGTVGITSSAASAATCQAKDGVVSSSNLQSIIDGATTGDTILIKGTCVGNFAIPGGGSATNLTLQGVRRAVSLNTLDGNGSGSVLTVGVGTDVTITGLRITNGNAFQGGGIFDQGTVRLKGRTRVIGNTVTGDGGGVFNSGSYLYLSGKAQVNGNTAGIDGGGIERDGGSIYGATPGVNVRLNTPNDVSQP